MLLGGDRLALLLKDLSPVLDERVERLLRRALVGDDVVVNSLLHVEEELGVGWFGPEVFHDAHRLQELRSKGSALWEAGRIDDRLQSRIPADLPPLLLNFRLREPLDVAERIILVVRRRDYRDALAA